MALLAAVGNAVLDGILIIDTQGKKIYQNQRTIDLWGIPPSIAADPDDAKQAQFAASRTKHPHQLTELLSHLNAHPELSSHDEIELIDGKVLDRYSSPVRDEQGKCFGRIWHFRDMTERRRAVDALHRSEARYHTLFEQSPAPLWEDDWSEVRTWLESLRQSGVGDLAAYLAHRPEATLAAVAKIRTLDMNQAALQLLKASSRDQVMASRSLLFTEQSQSLFREVLLAFACGRRDFSAETTIRSFHGELKQLHMKISIPSACWNTWERVFFLVVDETERKRAEQALVESETRFRELADTVDEIFWIMDAHKNEVLYVSPAYERIQGRSCQSLCENPLSWLEGIHAEDRDRVLRTIKDNQLGATLQESYRIVRPDGIVRWVRNRAYPVRNANGEVERIVGVARDITDHRQLEEQLRQSQKLEAIGQLAGGIAHDFNNILTVIEGYASLLASEVNLTEFAKESVSEISQGVERAAGLTRQLLTLSRRQVMQPRLLNLNEVIEGILNMLRRLLGEHVALSFEAGTLPAILADPGMLEQILMNLAINARDAMPEGGRLDIRTGTTSINAVYAQHHPESMEGQCVWLEVADTGCGIPSENLQKIFEPFFTTKEAGKGMGLGLATVYGIVKQHRGWIELQSEPNHGTTFKIHLPASAGKVEPHGPSPVEEQVQGSGETILLVEDEAPLRSLARKVLEQHGYRVLEATNGLEAVRIWETHRQSIDLLFTDSVMPGGINGQQLSERLRRDNPELRVVCASGYSAELLDSPSMPRRGRHFLQKPFLADQLLRTIRCCLDEAAIKPPHCLATQAFSDSLTIQP